MAVSKRKRDRWKKTAVKAREGKGVFSILNKVKPLRRAMKMMLSQKLVQTSDSINMFDLIILFAVHIMKGKSAEKAEEIMEVIGPTGYSGNTFRIEGVISAAMLAAIASIIAAIASFFKGMKEARDRGELTPEQEKAVDAASSALGAAEKGAGTVLAGFPLSGLPFSLSSGTTWLVIGGVAVAAYLITDG